MDWHMVPAWVVVLLFSALVVLAYQCGVLAAELRFLRPDADRYSWLRRQVWMRDKAEKLGGPDIDAICDAGLATDQKRWANK